MDIDSIVAAFVGAILGSVLKGIWDRRLAKKIPKTDRRAQAYQDFATYFMFYIDANADARAKFPALDLDEIKARLVVFGESRVVGEVAEFLEANHESLHGKQAREDFRDVVRAMRKSVATGAGNTVMADILRVLSVRGRNTR